MTDLIARLRAPAYWISGSDEGHDGDNSAPFEAADELSALRERVEALEGALSSARHYVVEAVDADGGIDSCEIHMRHDLELIDAILAQHGGEVG